MTGLDGGALKPVQGVLGEHVVVADPFDFEECAIDLVTQLAEEREILDALVDVAVVGVIDRGFGRSACCSLQYCFTCEDLYSTCRLVRRRR